MFSDLQKTELGKPLSRSAVKSREQSGRKLSYIEGWHVIAEANRIFGFDGWSRETVDLKCVSERERTVGANKAPGWGVTYIAKVRVTAANNLIREGCGTGHGIDRDCGQAHESALKEAETDAMKRALMTFGNPFGLALYDKTQENVVDEAPEPKIGNAALAFIDKLDQCMTVKAIENYGAGIAAEISKLPADQADVVRGHFASRRKALKQAETLAA